MRLLFTCLTFCAALSLSAQHTITSRVWNDTNGNGIQNGGEPALDGVACQLKMSNGNLVATATSSGGVVVFTNVAEGTYKLDFDAPSGHAFTLKDQGSNNAQDSDVARNNGTSGNFTVNGDVNDVDCGLWAPGSVTARVWDDRNGNGIQNGGEPNINGGDVAITCKLKYSNGNVIATETVAADGTVTFDGVVPADTDCKLDFDIPGTYAFTLKDAGSNNAQDSDVARNNGTSGNFRTNRGSQNVTDVDAGVWAPGSVTARVWDDRNGNGIQNGGEPNINGDDVAITCKLKYSNGNVIATETVAADGTVTFDGVVPADTDCKLDFDIPGTYAFTLKDAGSNNSQDSDVARNNGTSGNFRTDRGSENVTHVDAGVWAPGSVTARVWDDRNGNGIQNGGEPNVNGDDVTITCKLKYSNGNVIATETLAADGTVTFTGVVPADTDCKLDFDIPGTYAYTLKEQGNNRSQDSDVARNNGTSGNFRTDRGSQNVSDVDAGVWAPGSVTARVWDDRNGNGIQNGGEPNINGDDVAITCKLKYSNGNVIATETVAADGTVTFDGVVPADTDCKLDFDIPGTYAFTLKDAGSNNSQDSDVARNNGTSGNFRTDRGSENVTDVDAGVWSPGTVVARVWHDANQNGKQNGGENFGLPQVSATLKYSNGNVIARAFADCEGYITFDGLVPADRDCKIQFSLPSGAYARMSANQGNDSQDSDAAVNNGNTANFRTDRGAQQITHIDAGYFVDFTADSDSDNIPDFLDKYPTDATNDGSPAVYTQAFDDLNGDGKRNGEDVHNGIGGMTVKLLRANGSLMQTACTHPYNGHVAFFDIDQSSVRLKFERPQYHAFTHSNAGSNDGIDSDITSNDGKTASFSAAGVVTRELGGFWSPGQVQAKAFNDKNGDGKDNDGADTGLEGVTVKLLKANGSLLQETTTNAAGVATFNNVPADRALRLKFERPSGHAWAPFDAGSNESIDSDVTSNDGKTDTFQADRGQDLTTDKDGGFWAPGTVMAKAFNDTNGDGKDNGGDDTGLQGVTVKLLKSNGSLLMTETTNAEGIATFQNVPADQLLRLKFERPQYHAYAPSDVGSNEFIDSDIESNDGKTDTFRADRGSDMMTDKDGGFWAPGTVVAKAFNDTNGDGKDNDGAGTGLEGVTVRLQKTNGSTLQTGTTSADGLVTFTNVPADQALKLKFDRPSGHAWAPFDAGSNESIDSDVASNDGKTDSFQADRGSDNITDKDGGFWAPGTVVAKAFNDTNGDGKDNDGAGTGLEGVTVRLQKTNGSTLQTGTTSADGLVTFTNVPADQALKLKFDRPSGHAWAPFDAGSNESIDSDVASNDGKTDSFQADRGSDNITDKDGGFWAPGSITARAFVDVNGDGKDNDGGDNGLSGVTVRLKKTNGSTLQTGTTDTDGYVTFNDVPADIPVKLDFDMVDGYDVTTQNAGSNESIDSDIASNGETNTTQSDRGNDLEQNLDGGFTPEAAILVLDGINADGEVEAQEGRADNTALMEFRQESVAVSGWSLGCFPNPAQDVLTLELSAEMEGAVLCSILDNTGRTVDATSWTVEAGVQRRQWDVSGWAPGLYHVTVVSGATYQRTTFVVSH